MRKSLKALFLFIILAGSAGSIKAQATKEVFSTAVDHINCETIRFIHREAGRAEAANNMDCLSFESIYKSIPADEAGTTGALCKNINDYKNKFKEDKPLDEQLNTVIAYANAKIGAKKRKGNVEDFKASLEKIKKDALDAAKGTPSASGTPAKTTDQPKAGAATDTSQAISEPAVTGEAAHNKSHKTDWLGLLALLVGLGALGLAYMAYSKANKSGTNPVLGGNNKSTNDDNAKEIQRVEKYFREEIAALQGIIEGLVQNGGSQGKAPAPQQPVKKEAPIGFIHDEEKAKNEERKAQEEKAKSEERRAQEEKAKNEERKAQEEKAKSEERRAQEEKAKNEERKAEVQKGPEREQAFKAGQEPETVAKNNEAPEKESETNAARQNEPDNVAKPPFAGTLFESASKPAPVTESTDPKTPKPGEKEYNSIEDAVVAGEFVHDPAVSHEEPFMPEKEYEDGEAVPFYKFVGLPNEAGYFEANSFTDEPEKDSVYEIEMYEDVPDKAFFSIRSNADIIRRAILDPQTYLAPCCTYTDDPAGKHTIVLVEEGMLRKENNRWVVYEKAKIKFE